MGQRPISFAIGEFYHLYNRGNSRQTIFKDSADYQRLLTLLYVANSAEVVRLDNLRQQKIDPFSVEIVNPLVAIGAYCLMPNHYHLLITPLIEDGISLFMKKLGTGYSMYFNKRHERAGSLFEGTFKSQWADTDEYLRYLFSYIYLNPMKLHDAEWNHRPMNSSDQAFLEQYRYSSYYDFAITENRPESAILNTAEFPEYFNEHTDPRLLSDWSKQGSTLLR